MAYLSLSLRTRAVLARRAFWLGQAAGLPGCSAKARRYAGVTQGVR